MNTIEMSAGWLLFAAIAGALGLAAVLLALLVRIFEWSQVFQPRRTLEGNPSGLGLHFEDIRFVAEDGVLLHGWWIPHPQAKGALLYLHGSGGNLSEKLQTIGGLHQLGLHVFAFDYRGYGESRGIPTEKGTYKDARAAYEVVRSQYGDRDDPPVILFGRSLGGAVAIQLALDKPVTGLIVEASFTNIPDMAENLHPGLPARRFCTVRYPSIERVGRLRMPKLFSHSRDDDLIPFEQALRLYRAAAEPKQFFEYRGLHNDHPWSRTPGYWQVMKTFVERVITQGTAVPATRPPG